MAALFFVVLSACNKQRVELERLGDLDFTRSAAIGGNFLSGYQDGALYEKAQHNSIASLLYKNISNYGGSGLTVPFIVEHSDDGIGVNLKFWESAFQTRSRLGDRTDCNGEVSLGPVKTLYAGTSFSDFTNAASYSGLYQAVPYMTTNDMWNPDFGASSNTRIPYYHRFASSPGVSTSAQDLIDANPSFVTVWLGMEDIYNYAITGGQEGQIPSKADFKSNLVTLLDGVTANGAKGVIANIPSIDHFPFFNLIPFNGANLDQEQADELNGLYQLSGMNHIHFEVGPNGFITYDSNAPNGIRHMVQGERLLLTTPLDSMKCYFYGLLVQYVNKRYTLTLNEVSEIHAATISYNEVIAELAQTYDFAFFDADAYFSKVGTGIQWNGANFSLQFVSGGFLSLDGLHPNQKGHELLTNEIIKEINAHYNTRIPTINCAECDGVLFP
jgi:hypothetical protein